MGRGHRDGASPGRPDAGGGGSQGKCECPRSPAELQAEDDVVKTEGELTEEESRALFREMLRVQNEGTDQLGEEPVYVVVPCPGGRDLKVVGTVRGHENGLDRFFWLDIVNTPNGCGLAIDDDKCTIYGKPSLRVDLVAEAFHRSDLIRLGGRLERELGWQTEDRLGTCPIDVVLKARVDRSDPLAPSVLGGYEGSVCGHEMAVEWDPEWTFYCKGDPVCRDHGNRERTSSGGSL